MLNKLSKNGLFVFTTHGKEAFPDLKSNIPEGERDTVGNSLEKDGFGFFAYKPATIEHLRDELKADVSQGRYGISFTHKEWVVREIENIKSAKLQSYEEGGWGRHHDVVAVKRI